MKSGVLCKKGLLTQLNDAELDAAQIEMRC